MVRTSKVKELINDVFKEMLAEANDDKSSADKDDDKKYDPNDIGPGFKTSPPTISKPKTDTADYTVPSIENYTNKAGEVGKAYQSRLVKMTSEFENKSYIGEDEMKKHLSAYRSDLESRAMAGNKQALAKLLAAIDAYEIKGENDYTKYKVGLINKYNKKAGNIEAANKGDGKSDPAALMKSLKSINKDSSLSQAPDLMGQLDSVNESRIRSIIKSELIKKAVRDLRRK